MIKIRNEQLQNARIALNSLDGVDQAVKDGDRTRVITEYFKFTPGALLLKVKLMNRLDGLLRERAEARNALLRKHAGGLVMLNPEKQPQEYAAFSLDAETLDAVECEIDLPPLTEADLQFDKNNIPASALAALGPCFATG